MVTDTDWKMSRHKATEVAAHAYARIRDFRRRRRAGERSDLGLICLNGIVVAPRPYPAWREKSNTAGEGRR